MATASSQAAPHHPPASPAGPADQIAAALCRGDTMAPTCTDPTKKGSNHCQMPEEARFSSAAAGLFCIFRRRGGQEDQEKHSGGCLQQGQGQQRRHHLHQHYCCLNNTRHLHAAFLASSSHQMLCKTPVLLTEQLTLMAAPWLEESVIMLRAWQHCKSKP